MVEYKVGDKVKFNKSFVEEIGIDEALGVGTVVTAVLHTRYMGEYPNGRYRVKDTIPDSPDPELEWVVDGNQIDLLTEGDRTSGFKPGQIVMFVGRNMVGFSKAGLYEVGGKFHIPEGKTTGVVADDYGEENGVSSEFFVLHTDIDPPAKTEAVAELVTELSRLFEQLSDGLAEIKEKLNKN